MVNAGLVEAILREQDDPGSATTRQMRELYNKRSGDEPIAQHTDEDKEFQRVLIKALEIVTAAATAAEEAEESISYTVKLKDADENRTPTVKKRSIIKLSKENAEESESEDESSDTEKIATNSSITLNKPFSPLFLNNMKKFGVSTDWLAKRSNSAKQTSYSRSSLKSNTSQLDAMIKSASTKPVRSSRKLSFIPTSKSEGEKENADPADETNVDKAAEETKAKTRAYELTSDEDEDEDEEEVDPKDFALRIPRVDLKKEKKAPAASPSDEEKKVKTSKKTNEQTQIEHLKKLLRASGIRLLVRKAELDLQPTHEEKIAYLEGLLKAEGLSGKSTLKICKKFYEKRATEKELREIRANVVDVKGHVKGGRTLRGQLRQTEETVPVSKKRKREVITLSSSASSSSDEEEVVEEEEVKPQPKKRRVVKMEASPEVSETEWESNANCE